MSRRRNPIIPRGLVGGQLMPALWGGAGGVLNDIAYGFLPLPAEFATGTMRHVGKAASALALGYVGRMVLGKRTADMIAVGALTVVGYNVVRELVARFAPNVNMGYYLEPGMGYPGAGWDPTYGGVDNTMGVGALLPRTGSGGGGPGPVGVPTQLDVGAYGGMGGWSANGYDD